MLGLKEKKRKRLARPDPGNQGLVTDEEIKYFSLKKIMRVIANQWFVLLCAGISVLLVCSLYFYFQNDREATVVLSLNYEQSTQGLTPNDTRFSISEVRSEAVAQRAIQYAGLEGQIDPEDLIDCIEVGTYTNRGYDYDDAYIATSFYITVVDGYEKNTKGACPPGEMLKLVMKAYKDVFFSSYVSDEIIFTMEEVDYTDMEYLNITAYLEKRLNQVNTFLSKLVNEDIAFASEETGMTFQKLQEIRDNIHDVTYQDFKAYVWENGLAKDPTLTIETLNYQNSNLQKDYKRAMDEHDIRVTIIEEYQNKMIDSVLIPTYDDKGEYYMARTKTGIDELANEAEGYLQEANSYQVQMDQNQDMIQNIQAGSAQGKQERAEEMIQSLDTQISNLEDMAVELNQEYQNEMTHNYLTLQYVGQGILNKLNFRVGIILAAAVCAVLLSGFYVENNRLEEKRKNQGETSHSSG